MTVFTLDFQAGLSSVGLDHALASPSYASADGPDMFAVTLPQLVNECYLCEQAAARCELLLLGRLDD